MRIDRTGREYVTFSTSSNTGATLAFSYDEGATWTTVTATDAFTVKVLVAGPDAVANPAGTVIVPIGDWELRLRITIGSEVIVRQAPDQLTIE